MSIIIKNREYQIIKKLEETGFGPVFQVLDKLDKKYYAIKKLQLREDMVQNYEREVEILSNFNCENIIKYYDSYRDNNNFYILMEYFSDRNLRDFVDRFRKSEELIEEKVLSHIIKQICLIIKEIHSKKIVHRDIKPENFFINENMDIKIGNFHISQYINTNEEYAQTLNKEGTMYYMAPEIIKKGIYNAKSDMYSLGCVIYELFTLEKYYTDKYFNDNVKKINEEYEPKWQEIIDSLLQIDNSKRMNINQVYDFIVKKEKTLNE